MDKELGNYDYRKKKKKENRAFGPHHTKLYLGADIKK